MRPPLRLDAVLRFLPRPLPLFLPPPSCLLTVAYAIAAARFEDMPRFLPWLLDGADDDMTARVLAFVPPPVQQSYQDEWRPAYEARDHWASTSSVT